ncbi:MAG TPA: serpin family protein [Gemmataceae bacterium]|nr:serpin family protein [Gemmataceae bacterium]
MPLPKVLVAAAVLMALAAGLAVALTHHASSPLSGDKADADAGLRKPLEMGPAVKAVVRSNSDFALDLYGRLNADNAGKNLFFSPYSISGALAMVAEGARGETAQQMGKVLHFPEVAQAHAGLAALNDHFNAGSRGAPRAVQARIEALRKELQAANRSAADLGRASKWAEQEKAARKSQALAAELNKLQSEYGQYELRVANALWGEKTYPFKQSYVDTVHKYYRTGGLFPVDFRNDYEGARKRINGWVEGQTNNRIKDLIPADALDKEAQKLVRLVLTNAIYFKGEWAEVFAEGQTKDEDFLLAGGGKVRVPTMRRGGMGSVRYAAFRGDGTFFDTPARVPFGKVDEKKVYPDERGFAVLELPYKGGELAMVVIVPRSADGLEALEKKFTAENLAAWVGKLRQRGVDVFLPKFKVETKYDLGKTLQGMGMVRAFNDPRAADGAQFDGMSESQDPAEKLYVSKVLHKAFVEVSEKGTEAAAATAVMMAMPKSAAPASVPFTPTFKADRPFLFLVRDRQTGSILFLGRMVNPRQ